MVGVTPCHQNKSEEICMNLTLKFKIYEQFRTQSDAAMCFGMREDRLSQIIHGRRIPTDDEKSYCDYYGKDLTCKKEG